MRCGAERRGALREERGVGSAAGARSVERSAGAARCAGPGAAVPVRGARRGSPAARGRGERASLGPGELLPRSRGRICLYFKAVPIFLIIKGFLLLAPQIHQWPHDLKPKQNTSRPIAAFGSRRLMAKGLCVDFFFFFLKPNKFRFPLAVFYW